MRSTSSIARCSNCTQQLLRSILSTTIDGNAMSRHRVAQTSWQSRVTQPYEIRRGAAQARMIKPTRGARPDIMLKMTEEMQGKQRSEEAMDMVGVMPDTFVFPTKMSEWFDGEMLINWLRIRGGELYTYWTARRAYKAVDKAAKDQVSRKDRISRKGVAQIGLELHQEMSQAFAAGDLRPVSKSLCSGLFDTLNKRIANRPKSQVLYWKATRRFGLPRIVSFKAFILPGTENDEKKTALMQAIVRLNMRQRLDVLERKMVRSGARIFEQEVPVKGSEIEKNITEHVVLQKFTNLEKDGNWKIFGLYQPKPYKEWSKENTAYKAKMQHAQEQTGVRSM